MGFGGPWGPHGMGVMQEARRRRAEKLKRKVQKLKIHRIPNYYTGMEHYVFLVAAFAIFFFFFLIKWLFYPLAKAGQCLAFE